MATYAEIHELLNDSTLLDKIEIAAIIAAQGIVGDGSPPANQAQRLKWAAETLSSTRLSAKKLIPFVLAANSGLSVSAIQGAADTAIQTNVDSAVDLFADLIA